MRLIKLFKYVGHFRNLILIKQILGAFLSFLIVRRTILEIYVLKVYLLRVSIFLKYCTIFRCRQLSDIAVTDYIQNVWRFKLTYNLFSQASNSRILLSIFTKENEFVSSLIGIFKASNWAEREIWDLYGIRFLNHTDLRRLLTDYGFKGFPFRKDFPLTGYIELRYDDQKGDIVYEPVELAQELRFFNFASGWETD